jgi:hypothetical protein
MRGQTRGPAVRALRVAILCCVTAGVAATLSMAQTPECDRACLGALAEQYLDALVAHAPDSLPWADQVRFSENDVGLMIGEGLWGTATRVLPGYTIAEPASGNVLWLGIVEEHGQAAYLALRIRVDGRRIADVETVLGRDGPPAPFADPAGYAPDPVFGRQVPERNRAARARIESLVAGYYASVQLNDGTVQTQIADGCERLTNGESTTRGEGIDVEGCRQQLAAGWYRYVDRVRSLRIPIIDEARGVAVAFAYLDHAARAVDFETADGRTRRIPVEYPNSHAVVELFKIEDGMITRIEGVTAFQPYLMPTRWVP